MTRDGNIKQLAKLFLRLGLTAFGGPAAHIAMMRDEVVKRRRWMNDQHFLDLVGATNLIPGPNSTELTMHIGRERGGTKGLVVAGVCFILPAVLITGFFAWLYTRYGQLPEVQPFIYGIKPAIIAIILAAIFPLAKTSIKNVFLAFIGMAVLILALAGYPEIVLMFGAGLFAMALATLTKKSSNMNGIFIFPAVDLVRIFFLSLNTKLFFIFLKIGAILYGSGYVLFAFLDTELVQTGMITRQQLVDAIAVGQFTPGPVFSSVTFVGYLLNGIPGAAISTVAIFLPSFFFVALLNPLVKKMRNSALFATFLDAVNVASVAIIIAVCYVIGKESVTEWRSAAIGVVSLFITFGLPKVNSAWIVLGGAVLGYLLTLI